MRKRYCKSQSGEPKHAGDVARHEALVYQLGFQNGRGVRLQNDIWAGGPGFGVGRVGCPSLRFLKAGALDLILMDWINARDRCGPNWCPYSRRTKNCSTANLWDATRDAASPDSGACTAASRRTSS